MKCLLSGSFYEISSLADDNNELNFSLQYLFCLGRYFYRNFYITLLSSFYIPYQIRGNNPYHRLNENHATKF